jgi:hypothetical protein
MEKTAVESIIIDLDNECKERGMFVNWDMYLVMEKEQIIQSYYAAVVDTEMIHEHKKFIYEGPEQYYNETYNK